MQFGWNPVTLPAMGAAVGAFLLAAAVLSTDSRRFQSRMLALIIALNGALALTSNVLLYSARDASTAYAAQGLAVCLYLPTFILYLLFLSSVASPWTRLLATRPARLAIASLAGVVFVALLANTHLVVLGVHGPTWYAPFEGTLSEDLAPVFLLVQLGTSSYGILVAVSLVRRSPRGSLTRRQALWYMLGFVTIDATYVLYVAAFVLSASLPSMRAAVDLFNLVLLPLAILLFCAFLAYGMLRTQLFDIDLKLKLAINKGTLGAVFLAAFFVVAQVVQAFFSRNGIPWFAGAVAAGLLLFALRPLERMANRVADAAMPGTQDTPAYAHFRKMEVYKAAVESFLVDGTMSPRERDALHRLAAKLGIAASDARALEADATL